VSKKDTGVGKDDWQMMPYWLQLLIKSKFLSDYF
jgi:hypothetical protein